MFRIYMGTGDLKIWAEQTAGVSAESDQRLAQEISIAIPIQKHSQCIRMQWLRPYLGLLEYDYKLFSVSRVLEDKITYSMHAHKLHRIIKFFPINKCVKKQCLFSVYPILQFFTI